MTERRRRPTLEEYLRQNIERGVIDHSLRAEIDADGHVNFYIHPESVDGETVDLRISPSRYEDGDIVRPNPSVIPLYEVVPNFEENIPWERDGF